MITLDDIGKVITLLQFGGFYAIQILYYTYLVAFLFFLLITWRFTGIMMKERRYRRWLQSTACIVVATLFMIPLNKYHSYKERFWERQAALYEEEQAKRDEFQARYNKAKAIFDERCKTAGEKIYYTVEGVEGITLLNVPQEYTDALGNDPMWERAALPYSYGGDDYVRSFLNWEVYRKNETIKLALHPNPGMMRPGSYDAVYPGYQYVDVRQNDNTYLRYRYPAAEDREDYRKMITEQVNDAPARYAVEFKPIIDPAGRQYWVAGLAINIYDTKENILMASKTWYSMEPGQGNRNQRVPWASANICPKFYSYEKDLIPLFVHQALKPKQGD